MSRAFSAQATWDFQSSSSICRDAKGNWPTRLLRHPSLNTPRPVESPMVSRQHFEFSLCCKVTSLKPTWCDFGCCISKPSNNDRKIKARATRDQKNVKRRNATGCGIEQDNLKSATIADSSAVMWLDILLKAYWLEYSHPSAWLWSDHMNGSCRL